MQSSAETDMLRREQLVHWFVWFFFYSVTENSLGSFHQSII